jgi:hypothetical protein
MQQIITWGDVEQSSWYGTYKVVDRWLLSSFLIVNSSFMPHIISFDHFNVLGEQ